MKILLAISNQIVYTKQRSALLKHIIVMTLIAMMLYSMSGS